MTHAQSTADPWRQLYAAGGGESHEPIAGQSIVTHRANVRLEQQERGVGRQIYDWLAENWPATFSSEEIAAATHINKYKVGTNIRYVRGLVRSGCRRHYRYTVAEPASDAG